MSVDGHVGSLAFTASIVPRSASCQDAAADFQPAPDPIRTRVNAAGSILPVKRACRQSSELAAKQTIPSPVRRSVFRTAGS